MRNAVNSLPEDYRVVIEEKFYNELQYEEISKKLNIPLHTVKNRVARGKRMIKEIFDSVVWVCKTKKENTKKSLF